MLSGLGFRIRDELVDSVTLLDPAGQVYEGSIGKARADEDHIARDKDRDDGLQAVCAPEGEESKQKIIDDYYKLARTSSFHMRIHSSCFSERISGSIMTGFSAGFPYSANSSGS